MRIQFQGLSQCFMTLVVSFPKMHPGPFPLFDLLHGTVSVCPRESSVCYLVLPFYIVDVSETFLYECLEFSSGYSPCFLVVVLVTLHVFWLLSWLLSVFWLFSWLLSMFSGCCLGYPSCFLVVVVVTLHVFWLLSWLLSMFSGCCRGYSPCFLDVVLVTVHVFWLLFGYAPCFVVVLVTLHVFWLLSWLLSMSQSHRATHFSHWCSHLDFIS